MRRHRNGLRRQRHWGRHGIVAALTVVAGFAGVSAVTATQSGSVAAPQEGASGPLAGTHTAAVPDATIVTAATHTGQFVTAHRPTVASTTVSLLLLLLLRRARRPSRIPAAVTVRRFRGGTPLRRGPPTFLAR